MRLCLLGGLLATSALALACTLLNPTGYLSTDYGRTDASSDATHLSDAIAIATSSQNACALRASGQLVCWGASSNGQLGNGAAGMMASSKPIAISGLTGTVGVALAEGTACALNAAGEVWCWGSQGFGVTGRGKSGDFSPNPLPAPVLADTVTNKVFTGASSLVGRGIHMCAISAGQVYCWGNNDTGESGQDPAVTTTVTTPHPVAGTAGVTSLSAGWYHNCALGGGGSVSCWGGGSQGELGASPDAGATSWTAVPADLSGLGSPSIKAVAAGSLHTCAIDVGSTLYCWGDDALGETGPVTFLGAAPHAVYGVSPGSVSAIASGGSVPALTAITCITDALGAVQCLGSNSRGQLARGTVDDDASTAHPAPELAPGLAGASAIALAGENGCAILGGGGPGGGRVVCWGRNDVGQCGDGSFVDRSAPVAVLLP